MTPRHRPSTGTHPLGPAALMYTMLLNTFTFYTIRPRITTQAFMGLHTGLFTYTFLLYPIQATDISLFPRKP